MEIVHKSVLLNECLQILKPSEADLLFVDGTLGEGGHTEAFLKTYPQLRAIGIDADESIQDMAKKRLVKFGERVSFYLGWSDDFFSGLLDKDEKPNLILLDLGISMFHYTRSGRGFSFSADEALDMRLNSSSKITAADIVNSYSEKELADLIFNYGEERYSRRIVNKIIAQRESSKFVTAKELADCVYSSVPQNYRYGKIHPATRTFQALRIAVNGELDRLPKLLELAFSALAPNGRIAVITFHSLEDRIVKLYFRELAKSCTCPKNTPICRCGGKAKALLLTKKGIVPSEEEVKNNSASRSARLRAVQKIGRAEN